VTPLLALTPFGFELPLPVIVLGSIIGMTYGLLAVGLVLVYRTNRIINFAHGEVGAFGAAFFGTAVLRWHIPYYLAIPLAFAAAGAMAALAEVAVIRRLRNAPRLMSIVATLGVGQFLVFFSAAFNPTSSAGFTYPSPPGLPEFDLGALRLTRAYTGMLVFGPIVVIALALFLRRSRFGLGIRAASANPEAARMAGIFAGRMSSLAWALAGMVSAFTAILVLPSRGFTSGESFGPSLLLRALAGAVIARMNNLPAALAAGIGLGVVEQLLLWNYPRAGFVEVALFAVILVALLVQRGVGAREEEKGSWAAVQGWRPLPEAVARLREVRALPWVFAGAALAVGALLPLTLSNSNAVILTGIMGFSIVGLSVGVITGLGGQLSLGQFALGAIGAVVSYHVSSRVGAFPLAFLYAGLGAAAVSLLIGIPALRIRGLLLTVSTLGFTLVTAGWVLQQPWALGDGVDPGRPIVLGKALDTGKAYYYFVLVVLAIMVVLARNVCRGGLGRLLVAVRDNEDNARAFTVPARAVKLQGFLIAGFIAGVGGAAYGHMLSRIGTSAFPTGSSIDVVAMAVIGGMSLLAGPLIGAFYIIGIPAFLPLDSAGLAAQKLGWLILILYLPGGIAQAIEPLRWRFVRWAARRNDVDVAAAEASAGGAARASAGDATEGAVDHASGLPAVAAPAQRLRPTGSVLLEGIGLAKSFGGVAAVRDVSLKVRAGEIVGLIGPNGAGKTTTFELLGGFTRPDRGRVVFDGEDVSDLGPEERGRRGLIRSFQDAALFPTMTVLDAARLSFERVQPTSFFRSVLGLPGAERDKDRMARELVGAMGLDAYRNKQIQELSTGTRRITEIACLLALRPTLLLLDEPSSGIAQRETEALGTLLRTIKDELDLTMLIIEHDIPLIMGLSDRIVAMDAGAVIAVGRPEVVRTDPLVVEAYLGGSLAAIERSGNGRAKKSTRKEKV
jgi:ABC-type branched-subunit amino acid transport system ATPase component/ABC-type branched-subunit amino acid transport system permease subunit